MNLLISIARFISAKTLGPLRIVFKNVFYSMGINSKIASTKLIFNF